MYVLKVNNLLQIFDVYTKMPESYYLQVRAFWGTRHKSEANYLILIHDVPYIHVLQPTDFQLY